MGDENEWRGERLNRALDDLNPGTSPQVKKILAQYLNNRYGSTG